MPIHPIISAGLRHFTILYVTIMLSDLIEIELHGLVEDLGVYIFNIWFCFVFVFSSVLHEALSGHDNLTA